jgi:type IV secretion system protein VirB8
MAEADKSKKQSNVKIKSWYSNRYQIVVVQRNILFLLTLISMLSVAVAVIFVKNILASKSLEPYVIEVEEKTGVATTVDQLTSQNFTADIMVRKYFLNQFVHAASGYDPKTYAADVTKVRLFGAPAVYSDFRRRIRSRDLGDTSKIDIRIKSIQFPNNNTARVRILKQISKADTQTENKDEVIDITFYFADLKLTMEERLINPLGFQVSKYLIAEEEFKY